MMQRLRLVAARPPQACRSLMTKVRLKWVKNRGLDHIIDRDTDVKAAVLLSDYIARSPSSSPVPARALAPLQKALGLTVPVLRFLRRYPTLFRELPHPRFPSLPTFSLTPHALLLRQRDPSNSPSPAASSRLARLLMMCRSRSLPLSALYPLRYDLGLPPDFPSSLPSHSPDLFALLPPPNPSSSPLLSLTSWPHHLAASALHIRHRDALDSSSSSYHGLKKPFDSAAAPLAFPMRFPRGYGSVKRVRAWMEEFHRLPYVSPYEDPSGIDPDSDLMEKRVVGVLHELLGLTVHKKTKRNYLRPLREELRLPHKFTRVFTRYPGIFYLSLKCKTTTVVLREGYERGRLAEPDPIAEVRDKYYYVMRTGLMYRGKGMTRLVLDEDGGFAGGEGGEKDVLENVDDEDEEEDNVDDEDECYEIDDSDEETESGED